MVALTEDEATGQGIKDKGQRAMTEEVAPIPAIYAGDCGGYIELRCDQ